MKKTFLIVTISILSLSLSFAQDLDPMDTGKALFQDAFKRAYNIEAGVELQSFLVLNRKAQFSDYLKMYPNTFSYYVSFPTVSKFEHSDTYMAMDWKIGKRMYQAEPTRTDIADVYNCEKMEYYFLGTSIQFEIRKPIGEHAYWAWKPGMYFDFLMGDLKNEITNGNLSSKMIIVSHLDDPQTLRPLDFGAAINVEFGIHAAYLGLSVREGLRNLAPKGSGNTIRNNGLVNLHVGYRFASQIAKEDQQKINNILP